jgi:hypothetical protein
MILPEPDKVICHAFDLHSMNSIAQMIDYAHEMGQEPLAVEIGRRDRGALEYFARGLGSHPCFIRWPIELVDRETSALRCAKP